MKIIETIKNWFKSEDYKYVETINNTIYLFTEKEYQKYIKKKENIKRIRKRYKSLSRHLTIEERRKIERGEFEWKN